MDMTGQDMKCLMLSLGLCLICTDRPTDEKQIASTVIGRFQNNNSPVEKHTFSFIHALAFSFNCHNNNNKSSSKWKKRDIINGWCGALDIIHLSHDNLTAWYDLPHYSDATNVHEHNFQFVMNTMNEKGVFISSIQYTHPCHDKLKCWKQKHL